MNLATVLQSERARVDAALARGLDELASHLPADLLEVARYGVLTGGKRIRPVLCASAYRAIRGEASGDPPDALYDLGASLEMIHAYSLMHDDLPCMDDAPLRRGRPTPHTLFGPEATAVAGAALIPAAGLQCLRAARALGLDDGTRRALVRTLMAAAGAQGMVGGQALDLLGEGRQLDADELTRIHRWKTGALLAAAPRMGSLAAGAEPRTLEAVTEFGSRLGLAFQIADDVLDATASADELGKEPSDVALQKSTYVALYGLDGAERLGRREVEGALAALNEGGLRSPTLAALARYILERRS